jgi:hypothetical protein
MKSAANKRTNIKRNVAMTAEFEIISLEPVGNFKNLCGLESLKGPNF